MSLPTTSPVATPVSAATVVPPTPNFTPTPTTVSGADAAAALAAQLAETGLGLIGPEGKIASEILKGFLSLVSPDSSDPDGITSLLPAIQVEIGTAINQQDIHNAMSTAYSAINAYNTSYSGVFAPYFANPATIPSDLSPSCPDPDFLNMLNLFETDLMSGSSGFTLAATNLLTSDGQTPDFTDVAFQALMLIANYHLILYGIYVSIHNQSVINGNKGTYDGGIVQGFINKIDYYITTAQAKITKVDNHWTTREAGISQPVEMTQQVSSTLLAIVDAVVSSGTGFYDEGQDPSIDDGWSGKATGFWHDNMCLGETYSADSTDYIYQIDGQTVTGVVYFQSDGLNNDTEAPELLLGIYVNVAETALRAFYYLPASVATTTQSTIASWQTLHDQYLALNSAAYPLVS